jgi:hypothetical protein
LTALLDVNILVALIIPEHQHHPIARDWLPKYAADNGWATCPVTELGGIRVCAQKASGDRLPRSTADGLLVLRASVPGYQWWPDAVSPATIAEVRDAAGGSQITDRYLLGLARRYGGRLVTFDRALAAVGGDDVICLAL